MQFNFAASASRPRRPAAPVRRGGRSAVLSAGALLRALVLLWLCHFAPTAFAHAARDLAGSVAIVKTVPVLHPTANVSDSVVTVTNTGAVPIAAPFSLVVAHPGVPGVAVAHYARLDDELRATIPVALPQGVLAPGASVDVPVRFANPRRVPFAYEASATGTPLPPEDSVTLTVTVYLWSGDPAAPRGAPAGAGVGIVADGAVRAVTDANGQATVLVPASLQTVAARRAPVESGIAHLALQPGTADSADIVLTDDAQVYGAATLRIDQAMQRMLQRNAPALTGRLLGPTGATIPLTELTSVEVLGPSGDALPALTPYFALDPDGSFRATNMSPVRFQTETMMRAFVVTGLDAAGTPYRARLDLRQAATSISGTLTRPATEPALDLAGITVTARLAGYDIVVSTVTDASGNFTLPPVPFYFTAMLTAEVERNGRYFHGVTTATSEQAPSFQIALKSEADVRQQPRYQPVDPAATRLELAASGARTQSGTLRVPQGTATVVLSYQAQRLPEGGYDEGWGVTLYGGPGGKRLFGIARAIDTEWAADSMWGHDSNTGWIERQVDVAALTQDGDAELTVEAWIDCKASYCHTPFVWAALRPDTGVIVAAAALQDDPQILENDRRRFSIPADSASNALQRHAQLTLRTSPGATVTNVKVDLDVSPYITLAVLDAPPGPGAAATLDGDRLKVPVTFTLGAALPQALAGGPDSSLYWMEYRFTVTGQGADGTPYTAERRLTAKLPLWHAPAGVPRYGLREPGGDDWVDSRAWRWVQQYKHLLAPVNDFSGEHGNDLGNASHGRGASLTMYPFYTFPGAHAHSGMSNYRQLLARIRELPLRTSADPAQKALGDAAAAQVKAWIAATRSGIAALAQTSVLEIGYIRGGPESSGIGPADWGYKLLTTGKVTVNGTQYDLAVGNWQNDKYRPRINHHHHLQLLLFANGG